MTLPYTICFCLHDDQVLMLSRSNPPNAGLWNGLGGKLEPGETPLENIHREVMEEAGLDLHQAEVVRFAGLVSWPVSTDLTGARMGMYAFLARLAPDYPLWPDRVTEEGVLSWNPSQRILPDYSRVGFLPAHVQMKKKRRFFSQLALPCNAVSTVASANPKEVPGHVVKCPK